MGTLHNTATLDDYRVVLARQVLAELPGADDNEKPYFWIGRLKTALRALADGWPSGVPGGMTGSQRDVLAEVLADAIAHREPSGACADCEDHPAGLCWDHAADLDRCDVYLQIGRELGIEVDR